MKALYLLLVVLLYVSFAAPAVTAQYACVRGENPINIEGSITPDDMAQLGRVFRDAKPSTCLGSSGTLHDQTFVRRDTHNFVNPYNENVCVRVEQDFTGCGGIGHHMQSVAYSTFNPLAPANNIIGDMGYSSITRGSYSFSVGPNASFQIGVNEFDAGAGCPLYKLKVTYLRNCRQAGTDLTNDGLADPTVYRPGEPASTWYTLDSESGQPVIRNFGTENDQTPGGNDYTGDGRTDLSVYRNSNHTWYYATNPDAPQTNFASIPWGTTLDKPVAGDFDADGKNDIAIFRPSEAKFYILRSSDGVMQSHQWGSQNDMPISGDFDGDTATDIAISRVTDGAMYWWILHSNFNYNIHQVKHWGITADRPVPGDYDGDAISDVAVFRPSTGIFFVHRSSDSEMQAAKWGVAGDVPQPADYDGDLKQDYAVYRPSNGTWYIHNSGSGTSRVLNWGLQFDQPMTTAYRILGAQQIGQELTEE